MVEPQILLLISIFILSIGRYDSSEISGTTEVSVENSTNPHLWTGNFTSHMADSNYNPIPSGGLRHYSDDSYDEKEEIWWYLWE